MPKVTKNTEPFSGLSNSESFDYTLGSLNRDDAPFVIHRSWYHNPFICLNKVKQQKIKQQDNLAIVMNLPIACCPFGSHFSLIVVRTILPLRNFAFQPVFKNSPDVECRSIRCYDLRVKYMGSQNIFPVGNFTNAYTFSHNAALIQMLDLTSKVSQA